MFIEVGQEVDARDTDVFSRVRENFNIGLAIQSLYMDSKGSTWLRDIMLGWHILASPMC